MTQIRYNNKSYCIGSNRSEDIVYNNTNVKDELDKINSNLNSDIPFRFGKDENGQYGYIVTDSEGADSVIPFRKGSEDVAYVFNATRGLPSNGKSVAAFYFSLDNGSDVDVDSKLTTTYANSITATVTKNGVGKISSASTSGTSHKITFTANKDLVCDILDYNSNMFLKKEMKSDESYSTTKGSLIVLVYK